MTVDTEQPTAAPEEVPPVPSAPGGRAERRRAQEAETTGRRERRSGRGRGGKPKRRMVRTERQRSRDRAFGMSMAIIAGLCLSFVATISFLGALKENRDQVTAYDNFRYELANGTAPVGQTDDTGQLIPPGTTVAILRIPDLGIDGVVNEGTTSGILMSGPGHRRDSLLPGQQGVSVIYGRRAAFGGAFADIASLPKGAVITTVTGQAEATYTVIGVRRAGDPVPPPSPKGRLTLITADGRPYVPDGIVIVDADLTSEPQPANPRVITAASLLPAELPLRGDSSAWIGVLLWAQALLVAAVLCVWAWTRWGRWETWIVGLPVVLAVGVATSSQIAQLLPNLM